MPWGWESRHALYEKKQPISETGGNWAQDAEYSEFLRSVTADFIRRYQPFRTGKIVWSEQTAPGGIRKGEAFAGKAEKNRKKTEI